MEAKSKRKVHPFAGMDPAERAELEQELEEGHRDFENPGAMTRTSKKVVCPGCGQGWAVPVRVKSTGICLFVCDECESTWFREEDIGRARATHFMDYMESEGLKGLWSEIERLT